MCNSRAELVLLAVAALCLGACSTSKRLAGGDAVPVAAVGASDARVSIPAGDAVLVPIGMVVDKPNRPFDPTRAGLAFRVPRKWRSRHRDGALVLQGPMRVPTVVMFEPAGRTLDEAVAGLPDELKHVMSRVRVSRRTSTGTLAGHPARIVTGSGTAEGHGMRWRATVVDGDRMAVVLVLAPGLFWGQASSQARRFERSMEARR